MFELRPGFHPNFDITRFEPREQRVLRRMSQLFHMTRHGDLKLGKQRSEYRYALAKPVGAMRGIIHAEREVMVVFSQYDNFQPRTLDAFDAVIEDTPEDFRVEKLARILISGDPNVAEKIRTIFEGKPDAPIVIPYYFDEFSLSKSDQEIISRIRDFTFSRDLFSVSSPLKSDLYFFGRSNLINEICSKLTSGENFGLFGLRRSGKTSLISGVARALSERSVPSITIDCQSPSVHQLRWNELLHFIVRELKQKYSISAQTIREEGYAPNLAATSFLKDMTTLRGRIGKSSVAMLFDEVERISVGTSSSDHWTNDRDFLLFWQSIRAGFQAEGSPFSFLIVGTNPSSIESTKIGESDNPLFGNVDRRYIPMFDSAQVGEMVNSLGAIMGVTFDDHCVSLLHRDFGGHPFLTRQVCSAIAKSTKERPFMVDRTLYSVGYNAFRSVADSYVESVVGLLEDQYEDEYEMLRLLGAGDSDGFSALATQDSALTEHLTGYGIVAAGARSYYFNIGVVEDYFKKKELPTGLVTSSDRIAEISRRRNHVERLLREKIGVVFSVQFNKNKRQETLLEKLTHSRREQLKTVSFGDLVSSGASPLYFDECKGIVLGNWAQFENLLEITKTDFEFYMNVVNRYRVDAHAKDVGDEDFEKVRVALRGLENALSLR